MPRGVLGASRAVHRGRAQGSEHPDLRRLQGQALQRRQPGLGHARRRWRSCSWRWAGRWATSRSASELKADEHGPALCDGKIDGFFYGVGHPSANIQDPTTSCGAKLVSLTGPGRRQARRREAVLREGDDRRQPVSQQSEPDADLRRARDRRHVEQGAGDTVYAVVKAVFDNFNEFKGPASGARLPDAREHGEGRPVAPLHEGALRYYKEKGWIK
jgi:TRAP transporter TAXI family solute receptor